MISGASCGACCCPTIGCACCCGDSGILGIDGASPHGVFVIESDIHMKFLTTCGSCGLAGWFGMIVETADPALKLFGADWIVPSDIFIRPSGMVATGYAIAYWLDCE